MALEKLLLDNNENGGQAGTKINLSIDEINRLTALLSKVTADQQGNITIDGQVNLGGFQNLPATYTEAQTDFRLMQVAGWFKHLQLMELEFMRINGEGEYPITYNPTSPNQLITKKIFDIAVSALQTIDNDHAIEIARILKDLDSLEFRILPLYATKDWVNSNVPSYYSGNTVPDPSLGKDYDRYKQYATQITDEIYNGKAIEDYNDSMFYLEKVDAAHLGSIAVNPARRIIWVGFSHTNHNYSDFVFTVDGVNVPLTLIHATPTVYELTYTPTSDALIQGITKATDVVIGSVSNSGIYSEWQKINGVWKVENLSSKGAMRLNTPNTQTIEQTQWTTLEFDNISMEQGGIVANLTTNKITVSEDSYYEITLGVNAQFPGTEELEVMVFINGAAYTPQPLSIQGRTTQKPVSTFWQSTTILRANDEVELKARNGDAGSFDCQFTRLILSIKKD